MGEAAQNRQAIFTKAIAAAVVALCVVSAAKAADPWADVHVWPQDMVGTLSCSAVSCHGGGGPRYWSGAAAGGEYVQWLGHSGTYSEGRRHYDPRARLERSNGDPHALAGQQISSVRFQEVLRRASQRAGSSVDASMYQRCARCHDPGSVARQPEDISLPNQAPVHGHITRGEIATNAGIGCETCHGGAKQWITVHYERDISRERLLDLGMVDTKNLFLRARLCASCHVGSAENDMNHDMIAAGHPPLRFEQASFEALIGTKHWDDRPQRKAEPEYEVQLWAAGRIAAAEAALALLEGRARRAAGQESGSCWLEFAEGNCFACHQPMRSLAAAPSPSRSSGTVAWQSWNLAMLNSVVTTGAAVATVLPPVAIDTALNRLRTAMNGSLEPSPVEIAELTAAARTALRSAARIDSRGRILDRDVRPLEIRAAIAGVPGAAATQNWEEICQQVAALAAARRAIEDTTGQRQTEAEQRLLAVAKLLRFQTADREWPAVFANVTSVAAQPPEMKLNEFSSSVESIRAELLKAALQINSHP
jgi:hypothetical protein